MWLSSNWDWFIHRENGHHILSIQNYSIDTVAKQIMLNEKSMWAIAEHLINQIKKQEDGHYIMMKDPTKNIVRIYKVSEEDLTKIEEEEEYDDDEYESSDYSSSNYSDYSNSGEYSEDEE